MARKPTTENGVEELSLLEFPLGLLTRERPEGLNTLVFKDSVWDKQEKVFLSRTVTVAAAPAMGGLPNCTDVDVLLALMKLTNDRHGFREREIEFTLYELRELLGWGDSGAYRKMLRESLDRWLGVTVRYENAWKENNRWCSTKGFHLIENVELTNTKAEYDAEKPQFVRWNTKVAEAVLAGNCKGLDWPFYLSLKTPLAKRLYRILDKRFGAEANKPPEKRRKLWNYDVADFCHNKLGMRTAGVNDCKKKLKVAVSELESRGVLEPLGERFKRIKKGVHEVYFKPARKSYKPVAPVVAEKLEVTPLEEALDSRGVKGIGKLLRLRSEEHIRKQIENWDDRNEHGEKLSPAWLADAIRDKQGYQFREGYLSKEERAKRKAEAEAIKAQREAVAEAERLQKAKADEGERVAFEAFLGSLGGSQEVESFAERALAENAFCRKLYRDSDSEELRAQYRETAMRSLWLKEQHSN